MGASGFCTYTGIRLTQGVRRKSRVHDVSGVTACWWEALGLLADKPRPGLASSWHLLGAGSIPGVFMVSSWVPEVSYTHKATVRKLPSRPVAEPEGREQCQPQVGGHCDLVRVRSVPESLL